MHKSDSKLRISGDDLLEINRPLGSKLGLAPKPGNSTYSELEGPVFSGRVEVHRPRRGLHLYVLDVHCFRDVELTVGMERPAYLFSLVMSGNCSMRTPRLNGGRTHTAFTPGGTVACFFQADRTRFDIAGGQTHRIVDLYIDPDEARDMNDPCGGSLYEPLNDFLARSRGDFNGHKALLTRRLENISRQILNCSLAGLPRQLFMESKALEILALEMEAHSGFSASDSHSNNTDLERLEMARLILQKEYSDPPSLLQLARRVGLNDFKLKQGFREHYNTTVFAYLRRIRMERAWEHLTKGGFNVSEAASATGYKCFGHFSAAFKKHFGVLPSLVRPQ